MFHLGKASASYSGISDNFYTGRVVYSILIKWIEIALILVEKQNLSSFFQAIVVMKDFFSLSRD